MHDDDTLTVRVAAVETLTPQIRSFRMVAADGAMLPGFAPGAHLQVRIPAAPGRRESAQWRSYSLIHVDPGADTARGVAEYRIAVRREDDGRGGSRFMHEEVQRGDTLTLRTPVNHFPLEAPPEVILLAGGIGVTPMISMATALLAQRRPFRLHYSGRSRAQLAFADELQSLLGDRLHLHTDDDASSRLSIEALLAAANPQQPIYVCGPAGMIDATLQIAERLGWPRSALHYELFVEAQPLAGDQPFDVELASSGRVITVPADKSLLAALADAGCDVMSDCRSGYCGLCSTPVCSGDIEHRDTYLSEAEKASGRVMQVCVSRARSSRLVLDL
jgi:vanillate O-demethylase ferredoxin subunit